MKKILLLIFIIPVVIHAQIVSGGEMKTLPAIEPTPKKEKKEEGFTPKKPWVVMEIDSMTFIKQMGTEFQYYYQQDIKRQSSHKLLCLWAGAKGEYLYNFAYFLGVNNYNVTWSHTSKMVKIIATQKAYTTSKPPTVTLFAPVNYKDQILSATITGPADDIINIFLDYWELTDVSFNYLKSKRQITKDFVSDRVAFTWFGANPVIKVSKNPDRAMDIFPFR